jgi:hypothetical protein
MNKIEVGQLLYKNGLDMNDLKAEIGGEIISIDSDDLSINYARSEIERWIIKKKGDDAIITLDYLKNREQLINELGD